MSDRVPTSRAAAVDGAVSERVRDQMTEQATIDGRDRLHEPDLETLLRGIAARLDAVLGDEGTTGRQGDAASTPSHGVASGDGEAIQAWSSALLAPASRAQTSDRLGALATTVLRTAPDMPAAGRDETPLERSARNATPHADALHVPTAKTTDPEHREALARSRTPSHVDGLIRTARGRLATRQRADVAAAARRRLGLVGRGKALLRRPRSVVLTLAAIAAGMIAAIVLI